MTCCLQNIAARILAPDVVCYKLKCLCFKFIFIVSCSGTTADEAACDFLDFIGMQKLRSYLQGTKDFLVWVEKLKQQYPILPPLFSILTIWLYLYVPINTWRPDTASCQGIFGLQSWGHAQHRETMELLNIVIIMMYQVRMRKTGSIRGSYQTSASSLSLTQDRYSWSQISATRFQAWVKI
jgi:hypothetical protein